MRKTIKDQSELCCLINERREYWNRRTKKPAALIYLQISLSSLYWLQSKTTHKSMFTLLYQQYSAVER